MGSATIPVDLYNPGQVFACLGILEALEILEGPARGLFESDSRSPQGKFTATVDSDINPIARVLEFVKGASVYGWTLPNSGLAFKKWNVTDGPPIDEDLDIDPGSFPQPQPPTPASLPALLKRGKHTIVLDSWGDATRRDNVKFWAGAGGYPGAALVRDAQALIPEAIEEVQSDPLNFAAIMSSSLRLDWRRDYVPLDAGFSLNNHPKIQPRGYPIVELLAAIGLSHARPIRKDRRNKLDYFYGVIDGHDVATIFHRAALGTSELPFRTRKFAMKLDWPGQEGQARCITSVTEELQS